jgi:hypothetical protein
VLPAISNDTQILLLGLEICIIDTNSNWQEYGEFQNTSLSFSPNELLRKQLLSNKQKNKQKS